MKIFIFIPWFHPAYKAGGPIQSIANMVKQVGNKYIPRPVDSKSSFGSNKWAVGDLKSPPGRWEYEFSIFCSNKDLDGTILDTVPHDRWVQYRSNTRVWYSSDDNIIPILKKEISVNKPDLFYIVGLYDWNYNFKPLRHFKNIPKIISVRGMLHPGALSQKGFKKKVYLRLWKLLGWHRRYRFHVSDKREMGYVREVFGDGVDISVAGNFPTMHERMSLPAKAPGSLKLVSIALVSPMKNILLVLESLMKISELGGREGTELKEVSYTKFTKNHEGNEGESLVASRESLVGSRETSNYIEYNIYGPVKDAKYWQSCLEVIKRMPANVVVKYHGEVPPAEIGDVLGKHHVFVLPSKSENYGHAIIEALSAGLPVITSYGTPWNGLEEARAGLNVGTDDVIDLVNGVDRFVGMEGLEFGEWSEGARGYAVGRVDVEKTVGEYLEMFGLGNKEGK